MLNPYKQVLFLFLQFVTFLKQILLCNLHQPSGEEGGGWKVPSLKTTLLLKRRESISFPEECCLCFKHPFACNTSYHRIIPAIAHSEQGPSGRF